ncbi:1-aminocyclopropane-1-carboxylate deaminase [Nannochloropsis oceanica]
MGMVLALLAFPGATAGPSESIRSSSLPSFKVMEILGQAIDLEKAGHKVCHLEVGQPQSGAPKKVLKQAETQLRSNRLGYTTSQGIEPLRKRIAQHYAERYTKKEGESNVPLQVDPNNVVVTTGSSGAFLITFLAAFDVGDVVCIASAGYPCYRNILNALGCEVVSIPVNENFKVTAAELDATVKRLAGKRKKVRGLILSSPGNPTGAMLTPAELKGLCEYCDAADITFISDEIYHHISYGQPEASALSFSDKAIVINSFSKYYSMTGWRLGWMVAPASFVPALNRLSQNFFLNSPTLSQYAAVDAFDCREELDKHVAKYAVNRAVLLEGLKEVGLHKVSPADGAFYVYVDVSDDLEDAVTFAKDFLDQARVAVTPGVDFEDPTTGLGHKRLRFSYCGATEEIIEAMKRLKAFWRTYPGRKNKQA